MKINKCLNCNIEELISLKSDENQYAFPVYNPKNKSLNLNNFLPVNVLVCKKCGLIIPTTDFFENHEVE